MASRILNAEELEKTAPFNWQSVRVHLDDSGLCDCGSGDPVGDEQRRTDRIAELEHLLDVRVKEAHAAGIRDGEQRGRAQAAGELRGVIERLSQTIADAAGLRAQFRKEAEGELVKLAFAIARRILH